MVAASVVGQGAGAGFCALTPSGGVDCWGRGEMVSLATAPFILTAQEAPPLR
jgi:hypothetical protein